MPVYHFTIHAYRSWRPDNPRGYVHHTDGLLPPDPEMAKWYDSNAKFGRVDFESEIQRLLVRESYAICARRKWRLHAIGNELTHLHQVVSWNGFVRYQFVVGQMKGALSRALGLQIGPVGRKWFTRGSSERRVTRREHYDHLLEPYLPGHSGIFWMEGMPLP